MVRTTILMSCLVLSLVVMACSKTETTTNTNASSGTTEKPATAATPATSTSSTSGDNIGVPECDDFIAKYDACVSNKVPELVRAQYKDAIARTRSEMRARANDPATKSTMASYCKQALEQAKTSLTPFNCTW